MNKIFVVTLLLLTILLLASNKTLAASGDWQQGAVYGSTNATANSIAVIIQVPPHISKVGTYYIALSAWDSNGSYDQVGIINYPNSYLNASNWAPFYSWSVGELPLNNSDYRPGQYAYPNDPLLFETLAPGNYIARITANSGTITFSLVSQDGSFSWSTTAQTGGNYLNINSRHVNYPGYTIYEEGINVQGSAYYYNFSFFNGNWTLNGITTSTNWTTDTSGAPPKSVTTFINGSLVSIYNIHSLTALITPTSNIM